MRALVACRQPGPPAVAAKYLHHRHFRPPITTIRRRDVSITISRASTKGGADDDASASAAAKNAAAAAADAAADGTRAMLAKRAKVLERAEALTSDIEASPLAKAVRLARGLAEPVKERLQLLQPLSSSSSSAPPTTSSFRVDVAAHLVAEGEDESNVLAQLGPALDVRVTGTGPRVAFFFHGFAGKHECYTWAVNALAQRQQQSGGDNGGNGGGYTVVDYQRTDPTSAATDALTRALGGLPRWALAPLQDSTGWLARVLAATGADECAGRVLDLLNDLMLSRTDARAVEPAIRAEVAAFPLLVARLRAEGRLGPVGAEGGEEGSVGSGSTNGRGIIVLGHSRGGGVAARLFARAQQGLLRGLAVDGAFLLDPIDASLDEAGLAVCTGVACKELRRLKAAAAAASSPPPPRFEEARVAVVGAEITSDFNPTRRNYACFLHALSASADQEKHALLRGTLHSTFMDFGAAGTNFLFDLVCGEVDALQRGTVLLTRREMAESVRARYGLWEARLGGLDLVGAGDE